MIKNRKFLPIAWALLLCLAVFVMCFNGATHESRNARIFCYVRAVTPDGFVFSLGLHSDEYAFVKCDTQRYDIDIYDTIFVRYNTNIMLKSSGTVKTPWGEEIRYTYVVPATQLIRHARSGAHIFD